MSTSHLVTDTNLTLLCHVDLSHLVTNSNGKLATF